jgi:translation initiation factor 3 subunit L
MEKSFKDDVTNKLSSEKTQTSLVMAAEGELVAEKEPVSSSSSLPEDVEKFIAFFHLHLKDRNVGQIQSIYDVSFHKLTERFYKSSPWPSVSVVAPLVDNDRIFLMLYRELYYRHIYSKLNPSLQHRLESWENYGNLFNYLTTEEVTIDLPLSWLWDIVDEYVYQYQSFSLFRGKGSSRSAEESQILKANPQVWDTCAVLSSLSKLANKCEFSRYNQSYKHDDDKADTLHSLGFFSQITLARVHMLMGDYYSAIQILEPLDQLRKGPHTKLLTCSITVFYILGFSYMMMQRFKDASRVFHSLLLGVNRSKQLQSRSGPYDHVLKTSDRVYALLAIINFLAPQRLDDLIDTNIRERYGDKLARLQQGYRKSVILWLGFSVIFILSVTMALSKNCLAVHALNLLLSILIFMTTMQIMLW